MIKLTDVSSKQHSICMIIDTDERLEHGNTYYSVVWAYNGAINQRNATALSNGGNIENIFMTVRQ